MNSLVLQKIYNAYNSASLLNSCFPKKDRHGLGLRLENSLLDCMELVITAEQTLPVFKENALLNAVIKAELAKLLLRLVMERGLSVETVYFQIAEQLIEIQKMLNGWRNKLRQKT